MALLKASILINTAGTAPGTWADVPGFSATINVKATNSVILLLVSVTPKFEVPDATADFRFTRAGSAIGPVLAIGAIDNDNEGTGGCMLWAVSGISGSQTFAVQWQDGTGTLELDQDRNRSFQIIEILDGDANILVEQTSTGAADIQGTYANLLNQTVTPAGTGSVLLFVSHIPILGSGSARTADFRFADDGTREGPEITAAGWQSLTVGAESALLWVKTGISGSHVLSIQGQNRINTCALDTGRTRTFQVIEFTARTAILLNLTATGANTAPDPEASMVDVPGLAGTSGSAIDSSDSVILMMANLPITLSATDASSTVMFDEGDAKEGPVMALGYSDAINTWGGSSMVWAKTGSTGTPTFGLQWRGREDLPETDATRTRSFTVLEFKKKPYKLDGVTRDTALDALATVRCIALKHDGAAEGSRVYEVVGHDNSDGSGNYSITGLPDDDARYCVIAVDQGSPIVRGATDDDLTPVAE